MSSAKTPTTTTRSLTTINRYTVLLLLPDYMSDGTETFSTVVDAPTPRNASEQAKLEAHHTIFSVKSEDADDFLCLMVIEGDHLILYCDLYDY